MNIKSKIKDLLFAYLYNKGYEIIPKSSVYHWQKEKNIKPSYNESELPEVAKSYLLEDNPRLLELQELYKNVFKEEHLLWTEEHVRKDDIQYFRGDNAYVYQLRGKNMNIMGYALTAYYIKSIDKFKLLDKLTEDQLFGNYTFDIDGKVISRDLLDSINEIYFLENNLNLSQRDELNILDIGAGYGRLAHRMVETYPNLSNYYCTDAIAVSSFIAEYYLNFRKINNRSSVVTLDKLNELLTLQKIDVAVNIHSFSECSIDSVDWWLSMLRKHKVGYLMIVPNVYVNTSELLVTHDRKSISNLLEKHGYELIIKTPKFSDSVVQDYGINPTYYFLFKLIK